MGLEDFASGEDEYKFEDGPFLFNDGQFHFWTVFETTRADPLNTIRYLGTVRVRVGRSPLDAAKKRYPGKMFSICIPWKVRINVWRRKYPHKTLYKAPYPLNRALCKICGSVIESMYRHDFVYCSCTAIAVDGGNDYARRVGNPVAFEEMP